MQFSRQEVREILKAWFITSLAFAIAITVRSAGIPGVFGIALLQPFLISAVAVGLGVVLHELGHKYFGQKYGGQSTFKSFDKMLFLGVLLAFTGFLFILPGAVFTRSDISRRHLGILALAGPAVNFVLALAFLPLLWTHGLLLAIGQMGVEINFLLAAFNLLPFGLFDGSKVIRWNPVVWGACFVLASIGVYFTYVGL